MQQALRMTATFVAMIFYCSLFSQSFIPDAKLVSSDRDESDFFGSTVDIDGNYAIIGALGDDEDAQGLGFAEQAGAAYIFQRSNNTWMQVQKLVASDQAAGAEFGYRVAISSNYAIVTTFREDRDANGGNPLEDAGAAYVFERQSNGQWLETQKLVPSDRAAYDRFGRSVTLQGDMALIGAPEDDGESNLNQAGSVYVFIRNSSGVWEEYQKLIASDQDDDLFGWSVDLDGDYAIIGAYAKNESSTVETGTIISSAGAAYFFPKNSDNTFTETQKVIGTHRHISYFFGYAVAINGNQAVVGASEEDVNGTGDAGAIYTYHRNAEDEWELEARLTVANPAADDFLGTTVALQNSVVIAGAYREDENGDGEVVTDAGGAHVFARSPEGEWTMVTVLTAPDRVASDLFGRSVALSGNTAIVGSFRNSTNADNVAPVSLAGAAYTFEKIVDTRVTHTFLQEPTFAPNPTPGTVTIGFGQMIDRVSMDVYDATGRLVSQQDYTGLLQLDLTLPEAAGLYLIHLETGDGQQGSWKVVKL